MGTIIDAGKWANDLNSLYQLPLIALISYLLGSINTSIIVSKLALNKDIRDYGSGNAGFTNAVRSMGWKRGLIVLFGDVGKCAIAILLGQLIYSGNLSFLEGAQGRLIAGAFVFLGHIYPLYFKFKGGKGALTMATTVAMFDWRIFLIGMVVFFAIAFITKYISLASMCASLVVPIMVLVLSKTSLSDMEMALGYTAVAAFMSFMLIFKHRENIVRLAKGCESKFSFKGGALMEEDKNC